MTMTRRLKLTIPFVLLFLLLSMLWHELYSASPRNISSSMKGEALPNFHIPYLFDPQKTFTPKNMHGHACLLNVWASWCSACIYEHAMLLRIKNQYHVPIYGIVYRDNREDAMDWLDKKGNPFVIVANDQHGSASIDLGIYGTPETFVISPEGRIIYRHIGVIDQQTWNNTLYPLIKQYGK